MALTPAPCQRRGKRRLEPDGVINGYCAVVDPAAAGQAFEVTVSVEVIVNDQMPSEKIEAQILEPHEIVEKRRVFRRPGPPPACPGGRRQRVRSFLTTRLRRVPGISRTISHQTMKLVKRAREVPRHGRALSHPR